jgi:hypothetical protein
MKKERKIIACLILALLIFAMWVSAGWSQDKGAPSRLPASAQAQRAKRRGMSPEEKLVRDVYARLMRYQSAAVDEQALATKTVAKPEDYLTFELRAIHTGPATEIYGKPVVELITPRDGEVLTITSNHLSKGKSSDPPHASYTAEWSTSVRRNESADSLGTERKPAVAIGEDPGRPITARTIAEMFQRGGEHFASVTAYTSYEITARLNGKQRTYRALVVYQAGQGKLGSYQTEEERSARLARVEILDNVTSEMNTVLKDESPYARSPWAKYSKSTLYLAVIRTIRETKEAGRSLIPSDAPIGYLPGDDVAPGKNDVVVSISTCTACNCPTPMSDDEWNQLHGLFPALVRAQTCKLAEATPTYNCLAWTIDDTSRWWWDEADANGDGHITVAEMSAFYTSKGKSNIAYYGNSTSDLLHVAKKSGGNGSDCSASSKLGQLMRMAHNLNQLEGGAYGNIVGGN